AYLRAWSIQLALEERQASPALLKQLGDLAHTDSSPIVRLYLASGAQRLPVAERWQILEGLLAHAEDAGDPNLPLMYWYAAEPLAGIDSRRALALASEGKIPSLLGFMARRVTSIATPEALNRVVEGLARAHDASVQLTYLDRK